VLSPAESTPQHNLPVPEAPSSKQLGVDSISRLQVSERGEQEDKYWNPHSVRRGPPAERQKVGNARKETSSIFWRIIRYRLQTEETKNTLFSITPYELTSERQQTP
jgi:hypothetical protein